MDADQAKELTTVEANLEAGPGSNPSQEGNHLQADKGFSLVDQVKKAPRVVVSDDQYDFSWLEEAARCARREGKRFSLIDSGLLPPEKIEWLAERGADIYSSDEAQRDFRQLEFIGQSAKRGGSILAYFYRGTLTADAAEGILGSLGNLGAQGTFLHLATREKDELELIVNLGVECHRGGSWLVYYHRASLVEELVNLADTGTWLHLSSQQIKTDEDTKFLLELVKICQLRGGNVVLYLENELPVIFLNDLIKHRAFVVFPSQLYDFRSPYRPLQDQSRRMRLDFRAYYLYPRLFS
ncbi:MAG: hypothetical protein DRJ06_05695 [Candidatus Aminicenantes bacterium]|nr:MAG: hypothetical protein DRJ06_05695 [Candidatus Aminicenantes bacterium]